jgi:hypothetical protein
VKRIFEGERIHIETRPLVSGREDRLVVTVAANTVTDATFDGTNEALTALAELHAEAAKAIDVLLAARDRTSELRRPS